MAALSYLADIGQSRERPRLRAAVGASALVRGVEFSRPSRLKWSKSLGGASPILAYKIWGPAALCVVPPPLPSLLLKPSYLHRLPPVAASLASSCTLFKSLSRSFPVFSFSREP